MARNRPRLADIADAVARIGRMDDDPDESATTHNSSTPQPVQENIESVQVQHETESLPDVRAIPLSQEQEEADEEPEEESPQPYWKKFTAPYRTEQLERMETLLITWAAERHVKVSAAELLRLGLDQILTRMVETPDQVLLDLHRQEQHEQQVVPTRKFGRSRGIQAYLKRKRLI